MDVRHDGILLTDVYQLNMLQAYHDAGMQADAVFEMFVRALPEGRNFLMAAGLEQVVDFLNTLHVSPGEMAWLRGSRRFSDTFLDTLQELRFRGDVDAMPEGTVFFPQEPILRVTAPLAQAQLIETRLINLLQFQTVVASKAARMVLAAPDTTLVDFGLRRAHGAEAGLLAARAAYVAGFAGTATTVAAPLFDIPIYGTMAHSFILAHDREEDAFLNFARARPDGLVLLIDTYDTEAGAAKVVRLAPRLAAEGITICGVRLDSGDLGAHARKVRRILDEGGLNEVRIFASGGLDEWKLDKLRRGGAPIDGCGIGTSLAASSDAPVLDCAYKLQAYDGAPKRKLSEGKTTWPGAKQVFRRFDEAGHMSGDTITVAGDMAEGEPLLVPVLRGGKRVNERESLDTIRQRAASALDSLPPALRTLKTAKAYPVEISDSVRALAEQADRAAAQAHAPAGAPKG